MPPGAGPTTAVRPRPRPALRDPWTVVRVALVVLWLGIALATVLTGQRPGSLADLRTAVDDGRVDEVRVSAGLEPRTIGSAVQTAVWRAGLIERRTEVWIASPGVDVPQDARPLVPGDLADELRAADPGLRVVPLVEPLSSSEVLDWRVPTWVGALVLVDGLAVLFLLVGGPPPARATRWAWF